MSKSIQILNGPNLNMLGTREPEIYGSQTLADIEALCRQHAAPLGLEIDFRQSNSEGELVDWIQAAHQQFAAIILNAGAYTHTSIAILDALLIFDGPIIEVHISPLFRRDEFRHLSYVSKAACAKIEGFGISGYGHAITRLAELARARAA